MAVWKDPRVAKIGQGARGELGGFKAFILRGNVVDLAVGIVIGAAFTSVVTALVADFITPLIGSVGGVDFAVWQIHLLGKNFLLIGNFINAVISFLIVALVVYFFVVRPVNALMNMHKKGVPEAATTRDCPYCLSNIPIQATRCAYCTSPLEPIAPAPNQVAHQAQAQQAQR